MVEIMFKTSGAAFLEWDFDENNYGESVDLHEVARTIRKIADKVDGGRTEGKVMDYNGNCVGTYKVD